MQVRLSKARLCSAAFVQEPCYLSPPSLQQCLHGPPPPPSAAMRLGNQPPALPTVNLDLSPNGLPSEVEKSCEHKLETPKQKAEISGYCWNGTVVEKLVPKYVGWNHASAAS